MSKTTGCYYTCIWIWPVRDLWLYAWIIDWNVVKYWLECSSKLEKVVAVSLFCRYDSSIKFLLSKSMADGWSWKTFLFNIGFSSEATFLRNTLQVFLWQAQQPVYAEILTHTNTSVTYSGWIVKQMHCAFSNESLSNVTPAPTAMFKTDLV